MIRLKFSSLINGFLKPLGVQVVSMSWLHKLMTKYAQGNGLVGAAEFNVVISPVFLSQSRSQRGQDLIAFFASGGSTSGYYVEIGGADGLVGSNTYLLERVGWEGLVVEPARVWKEALELNRTCSKDFRAVYSESGLEIQFIEDGELSTLAWHRNDDYHLRRGSVYPVMTVSPSELFEEHSCPDYIDFLSIDTEGSEFEILKSIDFKKYRFGFICVEHNFSSNKEQIREYIIEMGYEVFMEQDSLNDSYFRPANALN